MAPHCPRRVSRHLGSRLSAQPLSEQREFAEREHLSYPLLNDSGFQLTRELGLRTFEANGVRYYRRLTRLCLGSEQLPGSYPGVSIQRMICPSASS
jgi:hypothetical protein